MGLTGTTLPLAPLTWLTDGVEPVLMESVS